MILLLFQGLLYLGRAKIGVWFARRRQERARERRCRERAQAKVLEDTSSERDDDVCETEARSSAKEDGKKNQTFVPVPVLKMKAIPVENIGNL